MRDMMASAPVDGIVGALDAMQAAVTGSALCVITQAGHLSNVEQPGPFNTAVARFVTAF